MWYKCKRCKFASSDKATVETHVKDNHMKTRDSDRYSGISNGIISASIDELFESSMPHTNESYYGESLSDTSSFSGGGGDSGGGGSDGGY